MPSGIGLFLFQLGHTYYGYSLSMEVAIMSKAETLYRLQIIDLEIEERNRRLKEIEASLGESEELRRAQQALQDGEKKLTRQRTRLRDRELDMRSLTSKIASVEDRLYSGRIKNPKELANLQGEVQYLKRRRSELEDQVLETMIEVEEGEASVAKQQERLTRLEEDWQQAHARLSAEQSELLNRLSQLKANRAALQRTIQAADLALYQDLRRRRGGQAVALLEGELCHGCGVTLPTSQAQQARQGEPLTLCSSCDRILYAER
jgi:predicted  nucleic acid-binding Zn-ribbon protein